MGAEHSHKLHFHAHSPIHALAPRTKLLALIGFMLVVVVTPREWFWAFAAYLVMVCVVIALAGVPAQFMLKRMIVEVPFLVFAVLMPFIASGPRTDVLGVSLSVDGLWGAWGLLAKGSLGVLCSLTLAATTEPRHLLAGLEQLHMPAQLIQIMGFMIRYLDVVTDEMHRMRIARESRGFRARSIRSWPVLAKAIGALFMRSYDRGERVHLAMLSRGYPADGRRR